MRIMQWNVLNQQNKGDKYFKHLSYLLTHLIFEFCIFIVCGLYTHKNVKRKLSK